MSHRSTRLIVLLFSPWASRGCFSLLCLFCLHWSSVCKYIAFSWKYSSLHSLCFAIDLVLVIESEACEIASLCLRAHKCRPHRWRLHLNWRVRIKTQFFLLYISIEAQIHPCKHHSIVYAAQEMKSRVKGLQCNWIVWGISRLLTLLSLSLSLTTHCSKKMQSSHFLFSFRFVSCLLFPCPLHLTVIFMLTRGEKVKSHRHWSSITRVKWRAYMGWGECGHRSR